VGKEALIKGRGSDRLLNRYGDGGVEAEDLEVVLRFLKSEQLRHR
jgi:hypothetical protein